MEGFERTVQGQGRDSGRRWGTTAGSFGVYAAERLVSAAEERIRHGGKRRGRSMIASSVGAGLSAILLKLLFALALLYFGSTILQRAIRNIAPTPAAAVDKTQPAEAPSSPGAGPEAARRSSTNAYQSRPSAPVIHQQSPAEMEAWRKRNAESMEILRESTPELPVDPRRQ
ncbi:hypothetical protein [Luteimonas sp. A649]